jgi:hypothetical protein
MADIYQSSDEIIGSFNPVENILVSGSTTITTSVQGGGVQYFYGSAIINMPNLDYGVLVPEAVVYVRGTAADGSTLYNKAPYTIMSTLLSSSGFLQPQGYVNYSIQRGTAKGSSYALRLVIYYISHLTAGSVVVDYKVKSTLAAGY